MKIHKIHSNYMRKKGVKKILNFPQRCYETSQRIRSDLLYIHEVASISKR